MMDYSTIIVGVLAMIGTLGGSYMVNSKVIAVLQEKMKSLEEKVEKHNQVVERTYKNESDLKTVFVKIDALREDIEDLKK